MIYSSPVHLSARGQIKSLVQPVLQYDVNKGPNKLQFFLGRQLAQYDSNDKMCHMELLRKN